MSNKIVEYKNISKQWNLPKNDNAQKNCKFNTSIYLSLTHPSDPSFSLFLYLPFLVLWCVCLWRSMSNNIILCLCNCKHLLMFYMLTWKMEWAQPGSMQIFKEENSCWKKRVLMDYVDQSKRIKVLFHVLLLHLFIKELFKQIFKL